MFWTYIRIRVPLANKPLVTILAQISHPTTHKAATARNERWAEERCSSFTSGYLREVWANIDFIQSSIWIDYVQLTLIVPALSTAIDKGEKEVFGIQHTRKADHKPITENF